MPSSNCLFMESIICELTFLPVFICSFRISSLDPAKVIHGPVQSRGKCESPKVHSQGKQNSVTFAPWFQLAHSKQVCFSWLISAMCFAFLCSVWVISLFKMDPMHRKTAVSLVEKGGELGQPCSSMGYSAVSSKFSVNK